MANDKLIYHITTPAIWQQYAFLPFYEAPSLQTEGFIHASLAHQVQESANRYFKDEPEIVLVTIDTTAQIPPLVYEESPVRKEAFPHLYGKLHKDAVVSHSVIKKEKDGYHFEV